MYKLLSHHKDNPTFPKFSPYASPFQDYVKYYESHCPEFKEINEQAQRELKMIRPSEPLNIIVEKIKNSICKICKDSQIPTRSLEQLVENIEKVVKDLENYKSLLNTTEQLLITEAVTVLTTSLEKVKKTTTSNSSVTT